MGIIKTRFKKLISNVLVFTLLLCQFAGVPPEAWATTDTGMGIAQTATTTTPTINNPQTITPVTANPTTKNNDIIKKAAEIQMPFITNEGQINDKSVKFYAKTLGGTLFVNKQGELVYSLPKLAQKKVIGKADDDPSTTRVTNGWALKEKLVGALNPVPQGAERAVSKVNYFIGNNESLWKKDITTFKEVSLGEVYPGIHLNLRAYGNNVEKLFIVKPGADVKRIRLKMEGGKSLNINNKGELEVGTDLGIVRFTKPVAYQENNGSKEYVQVNYNLEQSTYGFSVGNYDPTRSLIIDPLLASTFLGGSGSDTIYSVAFDRTGNVYVAGTTLSSNYPTTVGAKEIQPTYTQMLLSQS